MNQTLNKQGQLMVVVIGFFLTVHVLVGGLGDGAAPINRQIVTLFLTLGLAIRYWWVIILLPWPFRLGRTFLLLLAWSIPPLAAMMTSSIIRWALALAALSTIGCITEVYNKLTRQWLVGSDAMAGSLERDHDAGAVSAGMAAIILVLVAFLRPGWLDPLIALAVVADWVRLFLMIRRHQRFIELERLQ